MTTLSPSADQRMASSVSAVETSVNSFVRNGASRPSTTMSGRASSVAASLQLSAALATDARAAATAERSGSTALATWSAPDAPSLAATTTSATAGGGSGGAGWYHAMGTCGRFRGGAWG